ncbi:response regulator [Actinomycetospora chibensis]|uniref:histidine kinase n=1 Tax=Actinomycetospora chibensis TaxID=663606 RepID=A0ABV9RAS8_9PSEU|nr:response regulator [Actinomycetospora chibensis]MDD7922154.1 response regulator [Actinomycetospora chibensis]
MAPGTPIDRSNCEREPIHTPGAIQPGGALLAAEAQDGTIVQVSANAGALLGRETDRTLGASLSEVLGEELVGELRRRSTLLTPNLRPVRATIAGGEFDAFAYRPDEQLLVVELELAAEAGRPGTADLQERLAQSVAALQDTSSVEELLVRAARVVRELTGFDRVWADRFEPDDHGVIVAEDKLEPLPAFLGLHYPASDIPAQARALYLQNRLRLIPDAQAEPVPLVPLVNPLTGAWLDVSAGVLRAVSPMHIEYLRNMGATASMSIALSVGNRLWGLISAHHYAGPRQVGHEVRATCELIGLVCSMQLQALEALETSERRVTLSEHRTAVLEQVAAAETIPEGLADADAALLGVCDADGAAVRLGSELRLVGRTPDEAAVRSLLDELAARDTADVFQAASLAAALPGHAGLTDTASGLLAVPLGHARGNYLVWFRPEWVHTVTWGGARAATDRGAAQAPLGPHGSFAQWAESVRATSRPWREVEVESVLELRGGLGTFLLTRAEQLAALNAELARSNADLDAFAYIAAHDLKEPLRGINNFATFLVEDYHDTLGAEGREQLATIMRLARGMGGLLDSLLEYSRIGRATLEPADFAVSELVDDARELLAGRLTVSHAALLVTSGEQRLYGDRSRVRQVLVNLVANAIKYNEHAQPQVEISACRLSETRRGIELAGPDRRVDDRATHRRAARRHTLGRRLGARARVRPVFHAGGAMSSAELESLAVVEDNDEDFTALCRALRGTTIGEHIVRFRSGEEALERLIGDRATPDPWPMLVLLDLNLPGRRGLDVLSDLKDDPFARVMPVVVVSGSTRQEDIDAAYRRGANAYLIKALEFGELQRGLRALQEFWFLVAHPTPPRRGRTGAGVP